ncbi:MAG: universal stress protein [Anaerolineales bacterium]|nr:universal stress protein [Anaerolineales bacterium]
MIKHILVPLDGSSLAECVLPHMLAVAGSMGSKVTLLQVLEQNSIPDQTPVVDPLEWHIHKTKSNTYLTSVAERLQGFGLSVDCALVEGQAADQIIAYANIHDIDLIALSSHGLSGLSKWNVSSVVQKIILRSYKSILLVRAYQPVSDELGKLQYHRLLVPLDCSQRAECILPITTNLARQFQSQVLLTHVVSIPEMSQRGPLTQEDHALITKVVDRNKKEASRYFDHLQSKLMSGSYEIQQRLIVGEHTATILHDMISKEMIDLVLLTAHGFSRGKKWPHGGVTTSFIIYGSTPLIIMQDLTQEEAEKFPAEMAFQHGGGH